MPDKVISLVDADPELGELLDERDYERARREALARVSRLSPGVWDAAAALERDAHHRGFLIADGLMAREVDVHGPALLRAARPRRRAAARGRGTPRARTCRPRSAGPCSRRRRSPCSTTGWSSGSCRGRTLGVELFNRGTRRAHHLAVALAISHHQRVDDRLLLTLWHLAERWGRVTPNGIVVPLPLGHQRLADLVGRPPAVGDDGAGRAHPRRVDLPPRRRQLAAARRRRRSSCATTSSSRAICLASRARRGRARRRRASRRRRP